MSAALRPGSLLAIGAVAAGAAWVSMLSWSGLARDSAAYLRPLLVIAVVIVATGALARRLQAPALVVVAVQTLVAAASVSWAVTGSPVPLGAGWAELTAAFRAAVTSAQVYVAPVPVEAPPISPLLIAGGAACLLLVDVLACTLRRVALVGLPLLVVQSVPTSLLTVGPRWWVFVLSAAAYLVLLHLDHVRRLEHWGRALDARPGQGALARPGAARTSAGAIGTVAVGVAVVVPLALPSADLDLLAGGRGSSGGGEIRLDNPMVDLRRDLVQGEDVPLVRVTTTDRDPSYLRIAVLNRFSAEEWSSGDREIPVDQVPRGAMPELEGVAADVARVEHEYDVEVTEAFASRWLPTQAPVSAVDASGDWRFDAATMDFLAADDDLSTAGLSYEMTAVELARDPAAMVDAPSGAGLVAAEFTELPLGLSPSVDQIATSVTAGMSSPYEKAVALQNWFRRDGGFVYSTKVDAGNGTDDLQRFLTEDRVGYCEQFAAAMAVMARSIGIPARVAVGFLRPDPVGVQTWEYSSRDLHAWPELFVPGSGWVAFEPTPPARAADVPEYTRIEVDGAEEPLLPTETARPQQDDLPRGPAPVPAPAPTEEEPEAAAAPEGFSWRPVAGGALGLVVMAGALLLPGAVRRARRERRLRGGPEEAWAEVRDTARDLGLTWPDGRSPREVRLVLADALGHPTDPAVERPAHGAAVAPEAVEALDHLVLAVEHGRYARPGSPVPPVRAEAEAVVTALEAGAPRRTRRRAAWWPRTVFAWSTRQAPVTDRDGEPEHTRPGVVDRVG